MVRISLTDAGFTGVEQGNRILNPEHYSSGVIKTGEEIFRLGSVIGINDGELVPIGTNDPPVGVITDIAYKNDFYRDNPLWDQDTIIPSGTYVKFVRMNSNALVPLTTIEGALGGTAIFKGYNILIGWNNTNTATYNLVTKANPPTDLLGAEANFYIIGTSEDDYTIPHNDNGQLLVRLNK